MGEASAARRVLEDLFRAALRGADAAAAVARNVAVRADGGLALGGATLASDQRIVLLSAGKAAAPMAAALLAAAPGRVARGLVVTKEGHGAPVAGLELRETAHPVPDERCAAAGRAALEFAAHGQAGEALVVLLSGGASSLLACPADGLTLADLAATTELLLRSGADIEEANAVRKHLSCLAGGQLAAAWRGGPIVLLAASDVPGDRLDVIGSGPCTPDPSTFADAWQVVTRRGMGDALPAAVRDVLEAGCAGRRAETPKGLPPVAARVIVSNASALEAARDAAARAGLRAAIDPQPLAGEARDAALRVLADARRAAGAAPLVWLAGGETTVRFEPGVPTGRGGRNQELALAAALEIAGQAGVTLLAAGTDGSDGPTDAAGAVADGGTVARGAERGADAGSALACHDSHSFFDAEGGILRTGPTGTNVMDVAFVNLERD